MIIKRYSTKDEIPLFDILVRKAHRGNQIGKLLVPTWYKFEFEM